MFLFQSGLKAKEADALIPKEYPLFQALIRDVRDNNLDLGIRVSEEFAKVSKAEGFHKRQNALDLIKEIVLYQINQSTIPIYKNIREVMNEKYPEKKKKDYIDKYVVGKVSNDGGIYAVHINLLKKSTTLFAVYFDPKNMSLMGVLKDSINKDIKEALKNKDPFIKSAKK